MKKEYKDEFDEINEIDEKIGSEEDKEKMRLQQDLDWLEKGEVGSIYRFGATPELKENKHRTIAIRVTYDQNKKTFILRENEIVTFISRKKEEIINKCQETAQITPLLNSQE